MKRAVFLDRDGGLNRSTVREGRPYAPRSLEDFQLLPGVAEALARLRNAGFLLIVVTNQPDVAAGVVRREVLARIHQKLRALLPIDDIKVCCHVDEDDCACRKPRPGMLLEAAREWSIDLEHSFMVGDRWRDVSAGKAAGCKTIFVDYGYAERQKDPPDFVVTSLPEAAKIILQS
ncbi:MAG: HAD family hydrolase [Verrucomicrobia bacterium]|nr:MAG: HAD family hydrolase [Verrucomicrobiota bacterium]